MESRGNDDLKKAIDQASLVIPDGMPLIMIGRMRGFSLPKRAYGPDLFTGTLAASNEKGWRHYFYGSTPQILASMQEGNS